MSTLKGPRGDTFPLLVDVSSLTDSLIGSTFFITIKKNITDSDDNAFFKDQKTVSDNNNFYFTIPATTMVNADTTAIYVADIQRKAVDGTIESWPKFNLKFDTDVTIRTS
jgi:hypothetical protein